jgi:hypothetical protein
LAAEQIFRLRRPFLGGRKKLLCGNFAGDQSHSPIFRPRLSDLFGQAIFFWRPDVRSNCFSDPASLSWLDIVPSTGKVFFFFFSSFFFQPGEIPGGRS